MNSLRTSAVLLTLLSTPFVGCTTDYVTASSTTGGTSSTTTTGGGSGGTTAGTTGGTSGNPVVDPPALTPPSGSFTADQSVALSSAVPGAVIHYTIDGSDPTMANLIYSEAIPVSGDGNHTIKAVAILGGASSSIATGSYVINYPTAANVVISVPTGSYGTDQTVTLSTTTPGATIYYSTNGALPTASSLAYTAPILVTGAQTVTTLHAVALAPGYKSGPIASSTITLTYNGVSPLTFSPLAGNYTSDQNVTLSTPTAGAAIYYTTDGSTPTTSSTHYTGPIAIAGSADANTTTTLKAIATATGLANSAVASGAFTIDYPLSTAPVIGLAASTYNTPQLLAITAQTNAAIYFTTDGSNPNYHTSAVYNAAQTAGTCGIQAIALAPGHKPSPAASATFSVHTYVDAANGNDTAQATGSQTTPFASPSYVLAALDANVVCAPDVYVQAGTYNLQQTLASAGGPFNLRGGYDSSWNRNVLSNLTALTVTDNSVTTGLSLVSTSPSLLDGFSITDATGITTLVSLTTPGHTVSNNFIEAAHSTALKVTALQTQGGSTQVVNNRIVAGASNTVVAGVYLSGTGTPLVFGNYVDTSASGADGSQAVAYDGGGTPIIANNTIRFGGSDAHQLGVGAASSLVGTPQNAGQAYIESNILYSAPQTSGSGGNTSVCIQARRHRQRPAVHHQQRPIRLRHPLRRRQRPYHHALRPHRRPQLPRKSVLRPVSQQRLHQPRRLRPPPGRRQRRPNPHHHQDRRPRKRRRPHPLPLRYRHRFLRHPPHRQRHHRLVHRRVRD